MWISKRQRATINSAVKPFNITSNYLGPGLQKLIKYYSKYFATRRFSIVHFLPAYKNSRSNHFLTVIFNKFLHKGGFAKKRRPITWKFYGNILLTKYGKKKQQKQAKKKRNTQYQPKSSATPLIQPIENEDKSIEVQNSQDEIDCNAHGAAAIELHSEQSNQDSVENRPETSALIDTCKNSEITPNSADMVDDSENCIENLCFDDEAVDNIWNLDLQKVAALITEGGTDEKLSESENAKFSESKCIEILRHIYLELFL